MPAHLAPRRDRHRLFGALSVALGVGLLTIGALGLGANGPQQVGESSLATTEATVLGVTVTTDEATASTVGPDEAPPAVPATFLLPGEDDAPDDDSPPSGSSGGGSTTPTTGPAVIDVPTSVTNTTRPFEPTTTSTTEPTTTTTSTTTTEPPPSP